MIVSQPQSRAGHIKSAGKAWKRETLLEKRVEDRTTRQLRKQDEAAGRVDTNGWFITQQPLSS